MGFNPPSKPRMNTYRLGDGEDTTHLVIFSGQPGRGKFQLLQLYTQAASPRVAFSLELDETSMVEWKEKLAPFADRHGIVFVCGVPDSDGRRVRTRVSSFFILRSM
ncbi:hypothetical protein SPFM20_00043 [Salmonella phage SPFM20]|nr:hypothetical protein SPFM20_00043 [Salmonella phage SPFM20]